MIIDGGTVVCIEFPLRFSFLPLKRDLKRLNDLSSHRNVADIKQYRLQLPFYYRNKDIYPSIDSIPAKK